MGVNWDGLRINVFFSCESTLQHYNTTMMRVNTSFYKSIVTGKDQCARTPDGMFDMFECLFGYKKEEWFDVCPPLPSVDGLNAQWKSPAFCNPPFKDMRLWFDKAVHEQRIHGVFTLMLLPFRTAARYMHHHVLQKRAVSRVVVLTSRVRFKTYKKDFPLPIVLICVGSPKAFIPMDRGIAIHSIDAILVSFVKARISMQLDAIELFKSVYNFQHVFNASSGMMMHMLAPTAIICISSSLTHDVDNVVKHLKNNDEIDYVLLLIPSLFNGTAFRTLLPYISCIYLISPQVSLNAEEIEKKSFIGTSAVLVHHPSKPSPQPSLESIPGNVVFHRMASCNEIDFAVQDSLQIR